MKIKITNKDCGLEVGKEYDLCDMSATTLIEKRQAVAVTQEPIKEPKKEDKSKETKKVVKPIKGKANESNTK